MDMNLIENINNKLHKAEEQTNKFYNDLSLDEDFNKWFEELNREIKLEIYRTYQLSLFEDFPDN